MSGKKLIRLAYVSGRWVVIACLLQACGSKTPTKTKEQVMQERLDERLNQWHNELKKTCRKRVIERAVAIVDSTIIANARLNRDLSGTPLLPARPQKPAFEAPADSTPVKPILDTEHDSPGQ